MPELGQSKYEGWAVIEIFGHSKTAGFISTEYFGSACLFRVDTPEIPEREIQLKKPEYCTVSGKYAMYPAGTKVKREALPAHSELLGPSSIFRLHPCSEQACLVAIEEMYPRALILLELPANQGQIGSGPVERCSCEDDDCPNHSSAAVCQDRACGSGEYPTECAGCCAYHEAEDRLA